MDIKIRFTYEEAMDILREKALELLADNNLEPESEFFTTVTCQKDTDICYEIIF